MRAFTIFLRIAAAITILAGLPHLVLGPGADVLLEAKLSADALADPVLDSQNRFYGTAFMGYGALLLLCAADVKRHALLLRIVAGVIFLGGVARIMSLWLHGLPTPPVIALLAIEIIGVPLVLWWHARVIGNS